MSELMNSSFLGTKYMENCEAMTSPAHSFAYSYRLFKKCFDENLPYFLSDLRFIRFTSNFHCSVRNVLLFLSFY